MINGSQTHPAFEDFSSPSKAPAAPPASTAPAPTREKERPAIRTMKSDVETLFKTTKPSLLDVIGREAAVPTHTRASRQIPFSRNFVILLIGGVALALIAGGTAWWFLAPATTSPGKTQKLIPPSPLFATESSRTITADIRDRAAFISLMRDAARETEREGTAARIVLKVKDGGEERFGTLSDIFGLYGIAPPEWFLSEIQSHPMLFFWYGAGGPRFGFAAEVRDSDRVFSQMLTWESSLFIDARPFLFDETPGAIVTPFEDRTYRNIDWRFLKLSQTEDLGIGYTVFPVGNILIFTTAKGEMETVINRLFDAR